MNRTVWTATFLVQLTLASGGTDIAGRIDTVGGTTYDWQVSGPAAATIVYDPGYGIHVAWMYSSDPGPGFPDRNVRYNFSGAPGWAFHSGASFMNWGVEAVGARSDLGNMDVNPVTHCAYIGAHRGDTLRASVVRSAAPGSGVFAECAGATGMPWPSIGLTSTQRVHVALTLDEGINNRTRLHYARIDPWGTWSTPATIYGTAPYPGFPNYGLAASKLSRRVALLWAVAWGSRENAYLRTSSDDAGTWSNPVQLTFPPAFHPGSETIPSFDVSSLYPFYDSRDSLHIVAAVTPVLARGADSLGLVVPAEVWHWSTAAGWSLVSRAACDTARLAGNVGFNAGFAGRPSLCEGVVNEYVCVWEEFDSTNVEPTTGQLRADVFGCRSTDGGVTWGDKTRITDPDQTSKRFPSIAARMKSDSCLITYVIDRVAGCAALGQGNVTNNPVVVQRVAKTSFRIPVVGPDVGVDPILAPAGTIPLNSPVVPTCSVFNNGTTTAFYPVRMRIGSVYDTVAFVSSHVPGTSQFVTFPAWTANLAGQYTVTAHSALVGDLEPANDTARGTCTVLSGGSAGWSVAPDLPPGPNGKAVKNGACLAYDDAGGTPGIWAFKGNNTTEFYRFDILSGSWTTEESIPAIGRAGKKKRVKDGAGLCLVDRMLYAAKGNNCLEFWRYDASRAPSDSAWVQVADVPAGRKNVKGGAGIAAAGVGESTRVYFLKGAGTTEFYQYDPGRDSWRALPAAPPGTSGKGYKNGSSIALDPAAEAIFCLKGSYNELHRYDIRTSTWSPKASLPFIGQSTKKKKAKDGAGLAYMDGSMYALKGGNTLEFWRYRVDADSWRQESDMPPGQSRNVKGGGAIVSAGSDYSLYATKGNKTAEFYRYQPAGTDAGLAVRTGAPATMRGLSVAPNPVRTVILVSFSVPAAGAARLRLFDPTGRAVATVTRTIGRAGSHTQRIDRAGLSPGVYFLSLDCGSYHEARKLVLE